MVKLDEIMEVLTQEISGFNTSIDKLEELSKKFDDTEIKMAITIECDTVRDSWNGAIWTAIEST